MSVCQQRLPNALQISLVECLGQKVGYSITLNIAGKIRENDVGVARGEFPNHLTAASARRCDMFVSGNHYYSSDFGGAFAYRFEDRDSFGAHAQAISRVFYVATGEHAAIRGE